MHAEEVDIDIGLVARLIAAQFPRWADLAIEPVPSSGTDNAIYRLGDDMVVRLPRIQWAIGQVEKDLRWLPMLAPLLPLAIPVPLAQGRPAEGYPWEWGVYRWLEGERATVERVAKPRQAATDLARFLSALQRIDTADGPPAGPPNSSRGVPLGTRDAATRSAIASLPGEVDIDVVTTVWEATLRAPEWQRAPAWIHGDLTPGNMLLVHGCLSAIIDFAALCVGDPACDLMVAWTFLTAATRPVFQAELRVDEASWIRGRGWALSWALIALPYYLDSNPVLAGDARRTIVEVLADHGAAAD